MTNALSKILVVDNGFCTYIGDKNDIKSIIEWQKYSLSIVKDFNGFQNKKLNKKLVKNFLSHKWKIKRYGNSSITINCEKCSNSLHMYFHDDIICSQNEKNWGHWHLLNCNEYTIHDIIK